jgi:aromatic ring-opening dioxygenase catalytic subunit (LigB family)
MPGYLAPTGSGPVAQGATQPVDVRHLSECKTGLNKGRREPVDVTMAQSINRLPTLFIPHGGGPWPYMEATMGPADMWDPLGAYLRGLGEAIGRRPKAVLVVSGHWETPQPTVNAAARPKLLFDYYGFPEHTYRLAYPAPGSPELAAEVRALLAHAGIECGEDQQRGFDHGVFIPFMLIYPSADIPIVQLSLRADLDPAAHLAMGRALAPLRGEDVLIVGSGMSYHNLREFRSSNPRANQASVRFDDWLTAAVEKPEPVVRERELCAWATAPDALACHPESEHLVPLFVAAGAAGADRGKRTFNDRILGKAVSAYQFG